MFCGEAGQVSQSVDWLGEREEILHTILAKVNWELT